MADIQNTQKIRKLRKIRKARPQGQPMSFGAPAKVNYSQPDTSFEDAFSQSNQQNYYDNNGDAENIHFITEEELVPQTQDSISVLLRNKTVFMLLIIAALIGAIMGYILAPSGNTKTARGLEGVVANKDVPAGLQRCGLVEPHLGCVLYIMNPKKQEIQAKSFYESAAKMTKRERFMIDTSNMSYSSVKIKPGHIAQIIIPPYSSQ